MPYKIDGDHDYDDDVGDGDETVISNKHFQKLAGAKTGMVLT